MKYVFKIALHIWVGHAKNVAIGHDSGLKCVRHIRNDKIGFTIRLVSYVASDIQIVSNFKHVRHANIQELFEDLMRFLFNLKGSVKPNLASTKTLAINRGYLQHFLLKCWLEIWGNL